jgi:excisionase family DNA binding protein
LLFGVIGLSKRNEVMERIIVVSEVELKTSIREVIREELPNLIATSKAAGNGDEAPLMTRAEIAKYLRISLVTLTDWVKRGLPVHRKRKRGRVLFIKAEVLVWLKENQKSASGRRINNI